MLELLLVLATVIGIALVGLVTVAMTPPLMVELGLWGLAAGLFIGIPPAGGITSCSTGH
ncbi:MAG: hypothetical protein H8K10_19040 [Nitrospira sp.]|nr:hypothetical protein [Nitrospira sp.]